MKIANCCIAKMENLYIREYVEYYKKLGVDNIVIYDNNEKDGEHFEDVIGDYIESGFAIIEDIRGIKGFNFILTVYNHFYKKYGSKYDWLLYMDTDEFFTINDNKSKTLRGFLGSKKFKDCDMIHANWMLYDDNDMLENDGRKCLDRFTHLAEGTNAVGNNHIKTIIRGGLEGVKWDATPHTPTIEKENVKVCDCEGNNIENKFSPFSNINFNGGYIKHFALKTISEFCEIKMKRLCCDRSSDAAKRALDLNLFFERNKYSLEKVKKAKEALGINYKVVVVIPSGRRKFMRLLLPHVLNSYFVDEIHLWVNTLDPTDLNFINVVASQYSNIKLIKNDKITDDHIASIIDFYDNCNDENTIYLKIDDDVVFMEKNAIDNMVLFRVNNPDYFLVSPLIINNNYSTFMLCKNKKIAYPTTMAFSKYINGNAKIGEELHRLLINKVTHRLSNVTAFHCKDDYLYCNDFSINYICWFGKDLNEEALKLLKKAKNDELALSIDIPYFNSKQNGFCGNVVASHYSFHTQFNKFEETNLLDCYEAITKIIAKQDSRFAKNYDLINAIYENLK